MTKTDQMTRALLGELHAGLSHNQRVVLRRPRHAGVLIPIITDGDEPSVLFTRRASTLSSHRGEVAFPGGMRDEGDHDIVATSLREAQEEIGLPPESVEVVGLLDDLITINTDIMVTPVIGVIRSRPTWRANPQEVARIFEIPLSELQRPELWRQERRPWRDREISVFFFRHQGETLWGLSAHATLLMLDLLQVGAPVDLAEYQERIKMFNMSITRNKGSLDTLK